MVRRSRRSAWTACLAAAIAAACESTAQPSPESATSTAIQSPASFDSPASLEEAVPVGRPSMSAARAGLSPDYQRLEMLVGDWQGTSRAVLEDGREVTVRATISATWELDGHFVVAQTEYELTDLASGEPLDPLSSVARYTWDDGRGEYLYWTHRDDGRTSTGVMSFDPMKRTWLLEEGELDEVRGVSEVTGTGSIEYVKNDERVFTLERLPSSGSSFRIHGRARRVRVR